MTTSEKVAYLKGLCEMGVDGETKEGKIFKVIVDVLEDLALDLADTKDSVRDITDCMNEVSEDLANLEDEFYECTCDACDGCDCDCDCDCEDEDEEDDEDVVFYSVECPECGFQVTVDEDILVRGSFECPECGNPIDFSHVNVEEVVFDDEDEDEEEDD